MPNLIQRLARSLFSSKGHYTVNKTDDDQNGTEAVYRALGTSEGSGRGLLWAFAPRHRDFYKPTLPAADAASPSAYELTLGASPSPSASPSAPSTSCRLADGTQLAAAPTGRIGAQFAERCVKENIRRVVDLRPRVRHEDERGPFGRERRFPAGRESGQTQEAIFRAAGPYRRLKGVASADAEGHVHIVEIDARRMPSQSGQSRQQLKESASHHVSWVRINLESDKAITPEMLLDTSAHLVFDRPESGTTLYMCPSGQNASNVFPAAYNLLRKHLVRRLSGDEEVKQAVLETCSDINRHRGGAQSFSESDVATLMRFCRLMREADQDGRLNGTLQSAARGEDLYESMTSFRAGAGAGA